MTIKAPEILMSNHLRSRISKSHSKLLCFMLFIATSHFALTQDCFISSDIAIVANNTINLTLNVSGLTNDELNGTQGICGIRMVFEHDRIENLRFTLTSPSGQNLILIGPGRLNSMPSSFINWNIEFNACTLSNDPDPGINGIWDNGEPWALFSNYMGTYDPFSGCLEDLNSGSANGSWVLEIKNLGDVEGLIQYFEIIFCDPQGTACEECFLFPGDYELASPGGLISLCEGLSINEELLNVTIDPVLTNEQDYLYVYKQDNEIIQFNNVSNDVELLTTGTYEICGLAFDTSHRNQVLSILSFNDLESLVKEGSVCAELTNQCISLMVLEIDNPINVDTIFCEGDTIEYRDILIFEDFDTIITAPDFLTDSCDSVIWFSARMQSVDAQILTFDSTVVCGQSVFLNGSNSFSNLAPISSYRWETSNGNLANQFGPIGEALSEGEYSLIVESLNCLDTAYLEITAIDTFDLEVELSLASCESDSFLITILEAPFGTLFDFDGPGEILSNSNLEYFGFDEGEYILTASFKTCTESLNLRIDENFEAIDLSITSTALDCNNDVSYVNVVTNANNPIFNISGPESITSTVPEFEIQMPGEYMLEVIDDGGCSKSLAFEIETDFDIPEVIVQDLVINCKENIPEFIVNYMSPIDSVVWIGPSGFISNSLLVKPFEEGNYLLTVYGNNGCMTQEELNFTIENENVAFLIAGDKLDCINDITELCIESTSDLDSVFWIFNNEAFENQGCIFANTSGIYTAQVYSGLCFGEQEFELIDISNVIDFELGFSSTQLTCKDSVILAEIILNSSADNLVYQWEFDGLIISSLSQIEIQDPGNYSIVIRDTFSLCEEKLDFTIGEKINSLSNLNVDVNQPNCFPDQGFIAITGLPNGISFGIFINEEILDFQSLPNIKFDPGNYFLEIVDENGCNFELAFEIIEAQMLELNLGDDICDFEEEEIQINVETNLNLSEIKAFNWESQDSLSCHICFNPNMKITTNQVVKLEILDNNGCSVKDSIEVQIKEKQIYFIPNIFSPNGDGSNDDFVIYLSDAIIEVFDFRIFDRWGNLLLFHPEISGDKTNFVWDGFYNGKKVDSGVYVYMATLLLEDGKKRQIYGEINLIR